MMNITEYSVELVKDPFGIIPGKRYELLLDIEVPEDDELFSETGLYIRVVYGVEESRQGIVKYEIFDKQADRYLDFELEDEELAMVNAFCQEHVAEA
ncbi:DUF6509 family protein [Paenibacillus cremeus]|uniref:Pullulanase n=1 Tax=Paenibacillus cremeus TaxID=2163881 RepID=A0A559KFG4_9BACL|nr:DUF6509 family protein [Paenibacillus cremeus]TVY10872.1 pullulanase [Paenibacillus cremeus]